MNHAYPSASCSCTVETTGVLDMVQQVLATSKSIVSAPPASYSLSSDVATQIEVDSGPGPQLMTTLGDLLSTGRLLIRNWERINGCSNARLHLDASMLQEMANAIDGLVGLYEMASEAHGEHVNGGETAAAASLASLSSGTAPGASISASSTVSSPSVGSSNSSGDRIAAQRPIMTRPPVYLGTYALDAEEAALAVREAMRHSLMVLGEILNDIDKDLGDVHLTQPSLESARAKVGQATARLLRVLGKVNRAAKAA